MNDKNFNETPIHLTPTEKSLTGLRNHTRLTVEPFNKAISLQQTAFNDSIKELSKSLGRIAAQYAIDIAPSISKLSDHIASNVSISLSKQNYINLILNYLETANLTTSGMQEFLTTYINKTCPHTSEFSTLIEEYLEKLTENLALTDDDYIEIPEESASAISELTDFPEEGFEKSSESGFVKIKSALFHKVIIPLLIAAIVAIPGLVEQIWNDHQLLEETKSHNAQMLKEERDQTQQLEKQTELFQKMTDSDD